MPAAPPRWEPCGGTGTSTRTEPAARGPVPVPDQIGRTQNNVTDQMGSETVAQIERDIAGLEALPSIPDLWSS